jgi:hypothetical protein
MAQEEVFGCRDRIYSEWHRRHSTKRFVDIEQAQLLAMIDLDGVYWVEYRDADRWPVALVETARDISQDRKPATVLTNLAKLAGIPAFVALYTPATAPNPAAPEWPDIAMFRYRRVYPEGQPNWITCTPADFAQMLLRLRQWSGKRLDGSLFPANQEAAA